MVNFPTFIVGANCPRARWVKFSRKENSTAPSISPRGEIEGAVEFSFRENFTQRALGQFAPTIKVGKLTIPTAKLFEWIDKNKSLMQQSRQRLTLPLRTVFDV